MKKRTITLLLGAILHLSLLNPTYADEMKSLKSMNIDVTKPQVDLSEVAFLGIRCGVLFTVLGGYLIENSTKKSDRDVANGLIKKGENFSFAGVHLDTVKNGKSNEAIAQQHKALMNAYIADMLNGKRLNNSIATALVSSDSDVCNKDYPFYVELTNQFKAGR